MGGNIFTDILNIDPKNVRTEDFDKLWRFLSQGGTTVSRKDTSKCMTDLAEAANIRFDPELVNRLLNETDVIDLTQFRNIFFSLTDEFKSNNAIRLRTSLCEMRPHPIYGRAWREDNEQSVILLLDKFVRFLLEFGLDVQGIFRIPGDRRIINELKNQIDHNPVTFNFNPGSDVHDVTGALTMFLRQAPEPLFPYDKYDIFLGLPGKNDKLLIKDAVDKLLPPLNRIIVQNLIFLLNQIQENSKVNGMTSNNLAICICECFLRSPTVAFSPSEHSNKVLFLNTLIVDQPFFFEPRKPPLRPQLSYGLLKPTISSPRLQPTETPSALPAMTPPTKDTPALPAIIPPPKDTPEPPMISNTPGLMMIPSQKMTASRKTATRPSAPSAPPRPLTSPMFQQLQQAPPVVELEGTWQWKATGLKWKNFSDELSRGIEANYQAGNYVFHYIVNENPYFIIFGKEPKQFLQEDPSRRRAVQRVGGYVQKVKKLGVFSAEKLPLGVRVINIEDLKRNKELPSLVSYFAKIDKASFYGVSVAVKKFYPDYDPATFLEEVSMMKICAHPNILALIGICCEKKLVMVTEWADYGTLHKILHRDHIPLSAKRKLRISREIACALYFIHNCSEVTIHRELSSHTVFINKYFHVKIGGIYGASAAVQSQIPIDERVRWRAPELLRVMKTNVKGKIPGYDSKIDVYSYGIILNELFSEQIPFCGFTADNIIEEIISKNKRPVIPTGLAIPSYIETLTKQCWDKTPNQRPSFHQIVQKFETVAEDTGDFVYPSSWDLSVHMVEGVKENLQQIPIDPNSEEFRKIDKLVNSSLSQHGDISGVAKNGKDPKRLKIIKLERIQNLFLWKDYLHRKDKFQHTYAGRPMAIFPSSEYMRNKPSFCPLLDANYNEYHLFHGTSYENLLLIVNDGFDERISAVTGMFGAGIYFAENASKSNQYTNCKFCGSGSLFGGPNLLVDPQELTKVHFISIGCYHESLIDVTDDGKVITNGGLKQWDTFRIEIQKDNIIQFGSPGKQQQRTVKLAMQSIRLKKYLKVNKDSLVTVNADKVTPDTIFSVESTPLGIAFRSLLNNNYLSAQPDGTLKANLPSVQSEKDILLFFTRDCKCQEQGEFKFLLCRVLLGDIHICTKYQSSVYRGNPRAPVRRAPCKGSSTVTYDSILGESIENSGDTLKHREYIVYDRTQCYPEYMITYTREEN